MKRLSFACLLLLVTPACNYASIGPADTGPRAETGSIAATDPGAPPTVVSVRGLASISLTAAIDPSDNLPTFVYRGDYDVAPTIEVAPGDTIDVELSDGLPAGKGMASDVNLHFHGLGSSPMRPGDDVLTMLAKPFGSLHYVVHVPASQPPGLYWYHAHVHGETDYQVGQGGMSGALVVEGIAKRIPALAKLPEHVLMVRELGTGAGDVVRAAAAPLPTAPPNTTPCAPLPGDTVLTVNRILRPTIRVAPGRPEFFGVVNATGHRFLDLSIDGAVLHVVAIDGYPVAAYPGNPASLTETHVLVAPAGRVEFVAAVSHAGYLRTACYDSGPIGDPDPAQTLVRLTPSGSGSVLAGSGAWESASAPRSALVLPPPAADRVVRFSEKGGTIFYINGKAFEPQAPPMFVVRTGTIERWTVYNETSEVHDFHIHQVHFLVQTVDGKPVRRNVWRDTVVVPVRTRLADGRWKPGGVTMLLDFRSPIIKGTFVFHCHILDHEDRGMMAKIQAI
ncbi:MAG TPA: multicopper oxidase domain-containing protein [Candidatus Acidoferrales bacterium]|nr:multicopper oxidase domain-containing protein [Candidatus Acidoferrales bacterium]